MPLVGQSLPQAIALNLPAVFMAKASGAPTSLAVGPAHDVGALASFAANGRLGMIEAGNPGCGRMAGPFACAACGLRPRVAWSSETLSGQGGAATDGQG